MKRIVLLLFLLISTFGMAQVGVNTTTPDPSSMLDISATNKGVLVPRVSLPNVTTTQLDGTNNAATGLLIWNTNAATVGGNGVGFYFFNGTQWMPITQTSSLDHDIYEVGSTNPPNAINDNKYTEGSLTIGTNTAATGVLDVDNATKTTSVDINNTFATNPTGIDVNLTSNAAGKTGIRTQFNGTAPTGTNSFIQNTDNMVGNTSRTAINNDFSGTSSSISTSITGLKNDFKSTSNYYAILYGVSNTFASNTNAWNYGMTNVFTNGGTTPSYGVVNAFNGSSTGDITGFSNSSNNRSGTIMGLENSFSGTGDGTHFGINNFLSGTGTGNKYGIYNTIPITAGGTHYGIYSDVLKSGSFAGYFLGNVSIGTTTANNYILPPSRGTNGQIMQTDGSGNVSWVTPTPTSTTDSDWFQLSTTNPASAITDNIYTQGKVSIGSSTLSNGKLNVYNSLENNSFYAENTGSPAIATSSGYFVNTGIGTHSRFGIQTNISGGGTGQKFGLFNSINTSSSDWQVGVSNFMSGSNASLVYGFRNDITTTGSAAQQQYGVYNDFSTISDSQIMGVYNFNSSNGNGTHYGTHNRILGNGNGLKYGTYNFIVGTGTGMRYGNYNYVTGSGTNFKYGTYNLMDPSAGGTHYGLYSEALKAGSYAGYFLGNVSIGTTTVNNYNLPASRGTNGQTMQTDGSGNVSWVNPVVDTDTDDQTTDIFNLTGTTLNLSLQNDGVATQTVDLSSLQGDDDWTDVGANIERQSGDVYIGDTATTNNNFYISNQIIDWDNTGYFIDPNGDSFMNEIQFDNGAANDPTIRFFDADTGFFSPGTGLTAYSNNGVESFRIHGTGNISMGQTIDPNYKFSTSTGGNTRNIKIGPINFNDNLIDIDHDGQNGNGMDITLSSAYTLASRSAISTTNTWYDMNVDITRFDHLSTELYGIKSVVTSNITGSEYGIYAEALQADGYAGYFLGRTSIGTTTANNYILPASRGTNGQTMQTDGLGNVSWVNQTVDTDNQQIDVLSLTGDTLNISLQDDIVSTQTLNLGAIDNQGTDVFSLTGNTLNLSLQNDGVATQTVDLSSLSNDWKLSGNAGTVSGTDFIGTTDAQDLDFRVNNVVKIRLTQQGQLSFVNAGGSVFVGINAGDSDDLTSNQNTFVGSTSGQLTSTGNLNTAIGHASLNQNVSGIGNSGLGKSSLLTNTTGSNNTGLGRLADVATSGLSNATAVGYNSTVSVSDKVRLGSATVTVVEGQVPYTNPSDARFKFNVKEDVPGLDFIKKLKPVTYNFDTKKFDEHLNKNRNKGEVAEEDFSKSTAIIRTGFLAQDVEKICNDLGYNFDGIHIPDANNPTDNYGIAYSQFIMPIVKAVQEQQVIIENQKIELEQLKSEVAQLKKLEERLKALENKE